MLIMNGSCEFNVCIHSQQPLPEKHSMKLDRFSPEFLKTRQRALNKFVSRIAEHPTLSFNEYFKIFLTAKAWVIHIYSLRKFVASLAPILLHACHASKYITKQLAGVLETFCAHQKGMKRRKPLFAFIFQITNSKVFEMFHKYFLFFYKYFLAKLKCSSRCILFQCTFEDCTIQCEL